MSTLYRLRSIQPWSAARFGFQIGATVGGLQTLIGLVLVVITGVALATSPPMSPLELIDEMYLFLAIGILGSWVATAVGGGILGLLASLFYNTSAEHLGFITLRLKQ